MKVRLFEDSVRVRLTQREVMDLGAGRSLRSVTRFGVGEIALEVCPREDAGLEGSFADGQIRIVVNARRAGQWSVDETEGLYGMSGPCKIALEKDYACLHKTGVENEGTFPNPIALSK